MKIEKSEVLIIGSGAAGIRAAIELVDKKVNVLVVGKCKKRDAHTILATGGINAALGNLDPEDHWTLHAADTIKDGGFVNDSRAVKILCKNAKQTIKELDRWGCKFHKEKNGKISQRFFGAARYRRACFVGDHTGKAILNTLVNQAVKRKIRFKSEHYIFSLLTHKGKVNGALGLNMKTGRIVAFHTKLIIMAAGGASKLFRRSSSRFWENNGDGTGLAYKLGAHCMDMELFQFHPTGMVHPKSAEGVLVTEAVRGEGGILTNTKGQRFMKKYDPERLELSARDIVARAIYMEIKAGHGTKHGGVYLDISHRSKSYIKKRLPKMYAQFIQFLNQDISKSKMEVAPTAHYSMGGLLTNPGTGRTTVPNLYAIGEVNSGVHGGNRLGGNSLLECMVFGRLVGLQVKKDLKRTQLLPLDDDQIGKELQNLHSLCCSQGADPIQVKKDIAEMMWKHVGVVRKGADMEKALKSIQKYKSLKLRTGSSTKMNPKLIAALDIQSMLPTCEMIIRSALLRKESRAAHYRTDYLKTSKRWKKNIICIPSKKGLRLKTRSIPKIPKEIAKVIAKDAVKSHLLE